MSINKTGVVCSEGYVEDIVFKDMETKVLSDGSYWARILHHNNHSGTVLFTSANVMDIQTDDLYSRLYALEAFRDINGSFEFMVIQPELSETTIYRWKQSNNPTNTTTIAGYVNITNGEGGLVNCSANTLCAKTSSPNNWWCAVGCKTAHQGGIPGFGQKIVTGSLDLYVRVQVNSQDPNASIHSKFVASNNLYEY